MRQLCEADEEEFIEIMGLVGMTHKPLHVRRLQKALIEWRADRGIEHLDRGLRAGLSDSAHFTIEGVAVRNSSAALTEVGNFYHNWIPTATTNATTTSKPPVDRVSQELEESQQCLQPREVFVGAPKRPRLMDNLHRRPAASHPDRESPGYDTRRSSRCAQHRTSSPIETSSQRKNTSDSDESDDRLIEVLENSQSDTELEESAMTTTTTTTTTRATRGSPSLIGYPHSKYGRYKASLLGPQSNSGQA